MRTTHLLAAFVFLCSFLNLHAQAQFAGRWEGPVTVTVAGQTNPAGTVIMDIDSKGTISFVLGSDFPFTGFVNNTGQVTFTNAGVTTLTSGQITGGTMSATNTFQIPGSPFPTTYTLAANRDGTGGGGGGGNPDVLPYPSNVGAYRGRLGEKLLFEVTGSTFGQIWGTDIYTDDSSLARAAVHAGLLDAGESGIVEVEILPGQSSYTGSSRNGVTSFGWGAYSGSFSLGTHIETPPVDFTIATQPANAFVSADGTATLSISVDGSDLTYQWYRGSAPVKTNPIIGATAATLTVTPLAHRESYWVEITNASGSLASETIVVTLLGVPRVVTVDAKATGSFGAPVSSPGDFVAAYNFREPGEQVILKPSGTIMLDNTLIADADGIVVDRSVITGFLTTSPGFTALEERELDLGNVTFSTLPDEVTELGALIGIFVPEATTGQAGFSAQDDDLIGGGLDSEQIFLIGSERQVFVAPEPGTLYLGINEAYALNNSGAFEITVDPVIESDGLILLNRRTGRELIWAGNATLQSSPTLRPGSWSDIPAANSPYPITPSGRAFFRLVR